MRPLLVSHAGLEARLRGARPLGSYNLDNWREFTRRTKVRSLHLADVATDLSGVRCGKILRVQTPLLALDSAPANDKRLEPKGASFSMARHVRFGT
jgi:predicted aconitase